MGIERILTLDRKKSSNSYNNVEKSIKLPNLTIITLISGLGLSVGMIDASDKLREADYRLKSQTSALVQHLNTSKKINPESEATQRTDLQFDPMVITLSPLEEGLSPEAGALFSSQSSHQREVVDLVLRVAGDMKKRGNSVASHRVPLYLSVIYAESRFRAHSDREGKSVCWTISNAGAVGHMQNMPSPIPSREPVLTREDLGLGGKASAGRYAKALKEFCKENEQEHLAQLDVRFNPYKDIYYGIRTLNMNLSKFRQGTHTYYSYRNGRRVVGDEVRAGSIPNKALSAHTLAIGSRRDSMVFALAAYNQGAFGLMGTIVRHKVRDADHLLEILPRPQSGYIRKIMSMERRYSYMMAKRIGTS
jgi:hypothetical protein